MKDLVRDDSRPDDRHIAPRHALALALCAFALLLDGFDVYLVGNLGPAIAAHFRTSPASLSLVFLMQQTGLAVGAFLAGPIADRAGRKTVLLACAAAFGLLTLAGMLAGTLLQFAVLRGAAGLFLGGLIPNAIALLVGQAPPARRGLFVSIAFTGYGAGSVGGALVAALLLRRYGWQSGFWIGGLAPLLYVALAACLLSEPERAVRRAEAASGAPAPGLSAVFAEGRLLPTLVLWTVFILASGTIGLLLAWMPTIFATRGGVGLEAYSAVASFSLGGALIGTFAIGFLLDRFRSVRVLMITYMLMVVAMQALARAPFGTIAFVAALTALALFQGAGQTAISAISAQFYPERSRAAGIGWAYGAGRIGGIIGPALGGMLIAARVGLSEFFLLLSVPMLAGVVLLTVLDRASPPPREQARLKARSEV